MLALSVAEGFSTIDYPASSLAGASPYTAAFDGAWQTSAGTGSVVPGNLTYTGYGNAGENHVELAGTDTAVLWRSLVEGNNDPLGNYMDASYNVGASFNLSPLYFAFLVKVDGSTPPAATLSFYKDGITSNDRQFRIANSSTNFQAVAGNASPINLLASNANTNLFVIKIQFLSGNDTISIFQNPAVGGSEPSPTAQITNFNLSFDRIGLTRFTGNGTAAFDELRFGTSWASITQSSQLGTLPAPQTIVAQEGLPPSPFGDGTYPYGFFPFVDRFGQYRYLDWADKIDSSAELLQSATDESADLIANPGPDSWDAYGGWSAGPQLTATGYFRVQKYQSKWWLVDPLGRLFFSNGVDGVSDPARSGSTASAVRTGVTSRTNYFADLPSSSSPTSQFLATETSTVTSGYYQGTKPLALNQYAVNAYNKYGANWQTITHSLAHQRLRSWGMNTIGGWSDENVYLEDQTPYTLVLFPTNPSLINSNATFPDYFDAAYYNNVVSRINAEAGKSLNDPHLIGYYIHNELDWAKSNVTATAVGTATLAASSSQAAKIAFRNTLQAKYVTIAALNAQWQTSYASWSDFLTQRAVTPNAAGAAQDLADFDAAYATQYFNKTRQAMRAAAPNHLYLGSRFTTGVRAITAQIAAAYADVLSVNRYGNSFAMPTAFNGIDAPIIASEYGFNAPDTGLFGDDVSNATDQANRAALFQGYVESALTDSRSVGVHWFQYWDYPTAGRLGAGNNSQLGFVSVTNTPNSSIVAAARAEGAKLYETRVGSFAMLDDIGVLHVVGTQASDQISIALSGANLQITRGSTTRTFVSAAVSSIIIGAGYSDDTVSIGANIITPISFTGGLNSEKITINGASPSLFSKSSTIPGTLDLTNHDLVIDYTAPTAFASIFGAIASGRSGGAGIKTSSGGGAYDLALAEASDVLGLTGGQTAFFSGQKVDASSLLIKYTLAGDANLDGKLNADDYFQIDSSYGKSGSSLGYWHGDFDYNGVINGDDYFIIDGSFAAHRPTMVSEMSFVTVSQVVAARLVVTRSIDQLQENEFLPFTP